MTCNDEDCACWMDPEDAEGMHLWMTYWDSLDDVGKRIELGKMNTYDESEN